MSFGGGEGALHFTYTTVKADSANLLLQCVSASVNRKHLIVVTFYIENCRIVKVTRRKIKRCINGRRDLIFKRRLEIGGLSSIDTVVAMLPILHRKPSEKIVTARDLFGVDCLLAGLVVGG